jgi:hydroxymethylbilane synthase
MSTTTSPPPPPSPQTAFSIGTRSSTLALWQTHHIRDLLLAQHPQLTLTISPMLTAGDKDKRTALSAFNAKALWTQELEERLLAGELDLIVHCLKDMPTQLAAGCALGGAGVRAEARDCVVMSTASAARGWATLADLPPGRVVGTSSVRRAAQLRRLHPALAVADVRGNIDTRMAKLDAPGGTYAALVLAATGLQRLGLGARVSAFLSRREGGWLGAVGQGAIAVEIRSGDGRARAIAEGLMGDRPGEAAGTGRRAWWACLAERMLLRTLEGGCSVPIGVETEWAAAAEEEVLTLHAVVLSVDGRESVAGSRTQRVGSAEAAEDCGLQLAAELVGKGAGKILEAITLNRTIIERGGGA